MKHKKLILMIVSVILVTISYSILVGGKKIDKDNTKMERIAKKVNKSFKSTLAMYPTPNIEDLLNEKKGNELILITHVGIDQVNEPKTPLKSEGMVLYLNTKTKKGYGYYYIRNYYEGPASKDKEEKYRVYYDKGIHLRQSTGNLDFDKKIENFQFLVQYADFSTLNQNKLLDVDYNPNVPSFSLEYQLKNEDPLVQKLRQDYPFTVQKAPTLTLNGTGSYGENPKNNIDDRDLTIKFSKKPSEDIYSSVTYDNLWKEEESFWKEQGE